MSVLVRVPPLGPNVVGATGGSGTRVVARILHRAGMFIGTNLNESEDALDFATYSEGWINTYVASGDASPAGAAEGMVRGLEATVALHCAELGPDPRPWGWKEPRSVFLLPFLDRHLPALRFLHVVRDGRDMAFSSNQNQLRKHGDAVIGPPKGDRITPARSIALWSRINLLAARYGEERLGSRYLRIRFEDLCRDPVSITGRILDFFELNGSAAELAGEVDPPVTLEQWRSRDPVTVRELERIAGGALVELGYVVSDEPGGSGEIRRLRWG